MAKKFVAAFLAAMLAVALTGCSERGSVASAEKLIRRNFARKWRGSELIELRLDIEATKSAGGEWAERYGDDEALIFVSSIRTADDIEGSLSPNEFYTGWQWILTRKENGGWKLRDCGYG